jgi:hypothetical protein
MNRHGIAGFYCDYAYMLDSCNHMKSLQFLLQQFVKHKTFSFSVIF